MTTDARVHIKLQPLGILVASNLSMIFVREHVRTVAVSCQTAIDFAPARPDGRAGLARTTAIVPLCRLASCVATGRTVFAQGSQDIVESPALTLSCFYFLPARFKFLP